MENILQANPKIDLVISHSGESLCGALEAIKAAGRQNEMKLVSIDGYNGVLKAIYNGEVEYTVLFPAGLGAEAFRVCLKILNGEKVPKYWEMPGPEVTKENVSRFVDLKAPDSAWTY